jgi:hypothetical protein
MSFSVRYQILPLDETIFEGDDVESLQEEFLEDDLIENADEYGCSYLAFQEQEIEVEDDEFKFVLFQFAGSIVACAILIDADLYDEVEEDGFTGEYVFNASSIVTFDAVSYEELKGAFPAVEPLSKVPQVLDGAGIEAFFALIRPRLRNLSPEEFTPQAWIAEQLEAMAEMDEEEDSMEEPAKD